VPAGSVSYWPTAERERQENLAIWLPPLPHYRGEPKVDLTSILDSVQAKLGHDIPPPPQVAQLLNSSADPGQIISSCLFNFYVSHILLKSYENDTFAKTYVKF
jgi:hypothetical protein